jgi:DNA-binding protein H-NS
VDREEGRRYATLMKEIARLERQAVVAKKAEAAAAVRWIRKAIAEYRIRAAELGL